MAAACPPPCQGRVGKGDTLQPRASNSTNGPHSSGSPRLASAAGASLQDDHLLACDVGSQGHALAASRCCNPRPWQLTPRPARDHRLGPQSAESGPLWRSGQQGKASYPNCASYGSTIEPGGCPPTCFGQVVRAGQPSDAGADHHHICSRSRGSALFLHQRTQGCLWQQRQRAPVWASPPQGLQTAPSTALLASQPTCRCV